jgi:hypothetical protein
MVITVEKSYLLTYLLTYLICSSYTFMVSRLFFHFDNFTDGSTSWTSDLLVARHLPKHRTIQTQKNAHTHTKHPCLVWYSNPRSQCSSGKDRFHQISFPLVSRNVPLPELPASHSNNSQGLNPSWTHSLTPHSSLLTKRRSTPNRKHRSTVAVQLLLCGDITYSIVEYAAVSTDRAERNRSTVAVYGPLLGNSCCIVANFAVVS